MGKRRAEPGRCPWGPPGLHSLWPATLLGASILSSCFLWTATQATKNYNITIFADPPKPVERRSINFTLWDIPLAPFIMCRWFRGPPDNKNLLFRTYYRPFFRIIRGSAFSGRERAGDRCSLLIANLTLNDTGLYTVTLDGSAIHAKGHVTIQVLAQVAPIENYNITVFKDPPEPVEKRTVHFTLGDIPSFSYLVCKWFRGPEDPNNLLITTYLPPLNRTIIGAAFSWRETTDAKCSLLITNLNFKDIGLYTVTIEGPTVYAKGLVTIQGLVTIEDLGFWPKADVAILQFFKEMEDSVRLTCYTMVISGNISWFQNGEYLNTSSRIRLSEDKRTLTIQPVLRSDAGRFECQVSDPPTVKRSNVTEIFVFYGPSSPVIKMTGKPSSEPSNFKLTCKANSSPRAEYLWFHNGKRYSKGADLFLKNFSHAQLESFTCQAMNPLSGQKENTTLEIE